MEAEKKRKPSSKNIHDGHRDRMRERFLKSGFEAFAPHEKIEYLLFACNPRGDTNPLAHELIRRFGSFPECWMRRMKSCLRSTVWGQLRLPF